MTRNKGFTKIINSLLDSLYVYNFTDRQRRIILFVLRLTHGCKQRNSAKIRLTDFQLAGIYKSDIREELETLAGRRVIEWNQGDDLVSVNVNVDEWKVNRSKLFDQEKFNTLLTRLLAKHLPKSRWHTNGKVNSAPTEVNRKSLIYRQGPSPKESKERLNKEKKGGFPLFSKDYATLRKGLSKKFSFPKNY